jgi:YidC/Oxa1 family membrane protein insertase
MMNKLALYVFPLGVVVGGPFLPLAIIVYWLANNVWTFGQQHYVFGRIEKEEEAKKLEAIERRASNAPPPGAKPKRARKSEAPASDDDADSFEVTEGSGSEVSNGEARGDSSAKPDAKGSGNGTPKPGPTPRPGARPKKRKR